MDRYWPKANISEVSKDVAARSIKHELKNILRATLARDKCYISLTGGYDSRLLASCAARFSRYLEFFSFHYRSIPRHDVVLPRRVASRLDLSYRMVGAGEVDPDPLDLLSRNASHMCLDPSSREAQNLERVIGDGVYLQGVIGEQLRCFYQENDATETTDAAFLARKMRFEDTEFFMQGFSDWIDDVPESNVDILDLLYWECRVGIWAASCITFKEALVEILPPLNSRRLLETGLGTSPAYRETPHHLVQKIIFLISSQTQLGHDMTLPVGIITS